MCVLVYGYFEVEVRSAYFADHFDKENHADEEEDEHDEEDEQEAAAVVLLMIVEEGK